MAFIINKDGDISLIQGDSGSIIINGLDTNQNYDLYFAIQDKNRNKIGNELKINTNKSSTAVFELTGNYTDLLKVPQNQQYEIYYYGIKQCNGSSLEDTLIIGNNEFGYFNTITVFPKKVEGA